MIKKFNSFVNENKIFKENEFLINLKKLYPNYLFFFKSNKLINSILIIEKNKKAKSTIYWYSDDNSTIYLSGLNVNKEIRQKGIGKELQEIREQIGKSLNFNTSCLWVKKETWMHEWYKKRGYLDLKNHKQKGFIWMIKSI
jgi:GNAT superfamily N-acetyltransferase